MHGLLLGVDHGAGMNLELTVPSMTSGMHHTTQTVVSAAADDVPAMPDRSGVMDGCCGLAALCLAMIVGAGVVLWVARRRVERVLWQLPPPLELGIVDLTRSRDPRSPRERTCVLRC
jgi:hypothetical protein